MDRIKKLKIKKQDGTFSDYIPIGTDAENIDFQNGYSLDEIIGDINPDEDGTLEVQLSKVIKYYNTVADMKADTKLQEGDLVETMGYYEINDGGAAQYNIVDNSSKHYEELNNNLKAELIIKNNIINFRQLGARPQAIDNTKYDNKQFLELYLQILNGTERRIKLYIPDGVWYFSPTKIFMPRGFYIYGDECMVQKISSNKGTILTTYENNASHLFLIGDEALQQTNCVFKDCVFSSSNYEFSSSLNTFIFKEMKKITDTCIRIQNTQFMITDNLFFEYIYGQALGITTSWEIYFKLLNFRAIAGYDKSVINFETAINSGNITACNFNKIMFEGFTKNLFNFSEGCNMSHCDINTINIEDYRMNYIGDTYTLTTSSTDYTDFIHISIFNFPSNGYVQAFIVNNILLNNIATHYQTYDNTNYVFDTIINCKNATNANMIINNIVTIGIGKTCNLIYQNEEDQVSSVTIFTFNNCTCNNTDYNFIFNVKKFRGNIRANLLNLNMPNKDKLNNISGYDGFYNFLRRGDIPRGYLCYDNDCINHLKLAVKLLTNSESGNKIFARFPSFTDKFKIRAKIPNGETVSIYYRDESQSSGSNISVSLLGTGEYKWYEIFNQSPNENAILQFSNNSVPVDCYIDCASYI